METILKNVAKIQKGDETKHISHNYKNINPDISDDDAKTAMLGLSSLSYGELVRIDRINKQTIHTA